MKKLLLLGSLLCCPLLFNAQSKAKEYSIRTIAFYNVENLFDTINNPDKNDEASPIMKLNGNKSTIYWDKIEKLASVISQIGAEKTHTAPAIIGVAEVENKAVLTDLINSKFLKKFDYDFIHYESPDTRGIDVALLYQKKYFKPIFHEVFNPNLYRDNFKVYTRDQLLVSGYLDNELTHLIVNHWPSRTGGEEKTRVLREKTAYQNTKIIEQIRAKDAQAKIIIMGDFNDNPTNSSFKTILKTTANKKSLSDSAIYNPYENLFKKGYNTSGFRDNISLFDQILLSSSFIEKGEKDFSSYKMYQALIFNKQFLITQKGRFKGYPNRSFSYGSYTGGYSDHYPVYVYLIKEKN